MPDLEPSISAWRRQMLAAGIKTPATLEELEGHLRNEIERQMAAGTDAQTAFAIAAKSIGPAPELRKKFKKVDESTIGIAPGVLGMAGMVIFMNFILPHFDLTEGQLNLVVLWGLTLMVACGVVLTGLEEAAKGARFTK